MRDKVKDTEVLEVIDDLKTRHPSLQERLSRYRDRRVSYDAKHGKRATASPTHQGAQRTLRG